MDKGIREVVVRGRRGIKRQDGSRPGLLKTGERRCGMKADEVFGIEKMFFKECREAIENGRDFDEQEKMFYEAFVAVQNLRDFLTGKENHV